MSIQSIYKIPQPRGYSNKTYYIEDTTETSPDYFDIDDFPLVVGGGRYVVKLRGNGLNMRINTSIDVEILDAEGRQMYSEVLDYVDRFNNYYIAFDVYDITAQGIATAYFIGEALYDQRGLPIPDEYKNEPNVRWIKQFSVLPFERNNAELIFDKPPSVQAYQISRPASIAVQSTASAYDYRYTTSSGNQLTIVQSNFQGYDRDFASSTEILDPRLKGITIDPKGYPKTVNSVPTAIRENDINIENGSVIKYTSRFGTIVTSNSSFFIKDMLGGYFEFYSSESTPQSLQPTPPSGILISGSTGDQLKTYNATIVDVINRTQAVINKPLTVKAIDNNSISDSSYTTHTYKKATNFTASITYIPNKYVYATSSNVNQTYVEFTFGDLNPISGQVYRIKTSAKLGSIVGDYKLLNDQIVSPAEYLSDAQFSNGLNYAKHESDYRLIGYFATQGILNLYWETLQETVDSIDIITGSIDTSVQVDSTRLLATGSQSKILTTRYYQNYNENQTYTLGAYITLDPYIELEVYMNSDPLNYNVVASATGPRAFLKTPNQDTLRDAIQYNKFGKYVGKIVNDSPSRKYYGKVLFDFETDANGFGRPVYRSRVIDEMINQSGSAYISEVSIKPYQLNGYTPNIVQYAVPLPTEIISAASLSQSIDFKIDYFDYTGKQSEYSTYMDDVLLNFKVSVASNTCQDDKLYFYYYSGAPAGVDYYQPSPTNT